ncbi:hypothetical protein CDD83_6922 [Cordyceps sp. RAO-2017]|nr:hypothetical protein CDD83_6922 [Cordyceps sp. RAO-2017]
MKQLGAAAAWLEELGLAHCDIRPGNLLLYPSEHVKLADFDRTLKTGEDLLSGTGPFARLLGDDGSQDRGTYGNAGCRTEQFAVGSVFYSLTLSYNPFEDQWRGPHHDLIRMQKLQKKEFPPIGYSASDKLAASMVNLDQDAWEVTCEEDFLWVQARLHESETIARSGIGTFIFHSGQEAYALQVRVVSVGAPLQSTSSEPFRGD